MSSVAPAMRNTNVGLWVRRVPAVMTPGAGRRMCPRSPDGNDRQKPPDHHRERECHVVPPVLPLKPAKALPLLAAELVNAYSTSESPCGPAFSIDARSPGSAIATAVPVKTAAGSARM